MSTSKYYRRLYNRAIRRAGKMTCRGHRPKTHSIPRLHALVSGVVAMRRKAHFEQAA